MITADTLKTLTSVGPKGLAVFLAQSGYTGCSFETAKFLGITNGGQFCYSVTYHDDAGTGEIVTDKIFLSYNHAEGKVSAEY